LGGYLWRMNVERSVRLMSKRAFAEASLAAALASALSLLVYGRFWNWIHGIWGGGDLLPSYASVEAFGWFSYIGTDQFGYPFGLDPSYANPNAILPSALAKVINVLSGSPFVGVNLLIVLSFPLLAFGSLLLFRLVGLSGPLAIAGAVAFAVLPYHFGRDTMHWYLGLQFGLIAGLALVLLVGTGRFRILWQRFWDPGTGRPWRLGAGLTLLLLVVAAALSGFYYAFVSLLLGVAALVWRFCRGASWRELLLETLPFVGIGVVFLAGSLPSLLVVWETPPLAQLAERFPSESYLYAGVLALLVLPLPTPLTPVFSRYSDTVSELLAAGGPGVLWNSNMGTLVTTAALGALLVGLVLRSRRSATSFGRGHGKEVRPSEAPFILYLILFLLPWFVVMGLNYLFAWFVTPQLRGWDRLTPYFLLLFLLGGGAVLGQWKWARSTVVALPLAVALLCVTLVESVLPFRPGLTEGLAEDRSTGFLSLPPIDRSTLDKTEVARDYGARVNAKVPEDCGVLQLPYLAYPETGPIENLGAYEHFWVSLNNPDKGWSYGAMKNTYASVWMSQMPPVPSDSQISLLRGGDFCGIHLDLRAYDDATASELVANISTRFGDPVAVGYDGNWLFFDIRSGVGTSSEDSAHFFNQAELTPDGVTVYPGESRLTETWWWTAQQQAFFSLRTTGTGYPASRVSGTIVATPCGSREVTLRLVANGEEVEKSLRARPGNPRSFQLELDSPADNASLEVSTTGVGCALEDGERTAFVGVQDLQPW
jgi:hypothetical protein